MPLAAPLPLTAVIDRDDDAIHTHTALAAHHPLSGWITLHPGPGTTSETGLKAVIDGILRADLDAPRKQRHTVTRIFHRLVEENGAHVSYPMVRRYVADRKPQIAVEAGKAPIEAFIPQTHPPGMEADIDFGDAAQASA